MLAKCLCIALIICGLMVNSVKCSDRYDRIRQGARVNSDSITKTFPEVSLIHCSVLCSQDSSCNAFQFGKPSGNSPRRGSCELLVSAQSADAFDSSVTEDSSCNIYREVTHDTATTEKSTEVTTSTTTVTTTTTKTTAPSETTTTTETPTTTETTTTTPTTTVIQETTIKTDPICNYAGAPVTYSCNCSTSSSPCSGILQCTAGYADKTIYYYLDVTKEAATQDVAKSYCKDIDMDLIMVKTREEQSTICNILAAAVGSSADEDFWQDLQKSQGNSPYEYGDETEIGNIDFWGKKNPFGCVYLAGGSSHFQWMAEKKCQEEKPTGRALCFKVIVP